MKRPIQRGLSLDLVAMGGVLALVLAACSSAATPVPTPVPTAAAPTAAASPSAAAKGLVNLAQDAKLGAYLTGADGKSLYLFTKDSKDKSSASAAIIKNWPPLLVTGSDTPTAGAGVTGTLSTIKRDDGTTQVTYSGIPLYYYINDAQAGDIKGQALSGVWFLVAPASTASSGTISGGIGQGGGSAAPASPAASAKASSASSGSISIVNFAFSPSTTTVNVGSTVTWTNNDSTAHTVTAKDGSFDSKNISQGQTFTQTFSKAGTVTYMCTIHTSMTATITVVDPSAY